MKTAKPKPASSSLPEGAFTLIELLVVLAVLALCLAVLVPVRAQTKRGAERLTCLRNVKHWTVVLLMYADDHDSTLPQAKPAGGANTYWVDQTRFRDVFNQTYSVPREEFYCPANASWNRDIFWDWNNAGQDTVMNYHYFAGEPANFSNPSLVRVVPAGRKAFALKTTDSPYYTVLFADLMRKLSGSWGNPAHPDPLTRGVNHFAGNAPEGANQGFLDGHAEWVPAANPWIQTPKMTFGSMQVFTYGGKEHP